MANAIIVPPLQIYAAYASSTSLGSVTNLTNDYVGTIWQSNSDVDLLIDLGGDRRVDTLAIFGVELAGSNAVMQVFASTAADGPGFSPPTWQAPAGSLYAGSVLPENGKGMALWQAPTGFPPAVRYILLRFAVLGGAPIRLSRVVVGRAIQLERNFTYGAAFGVRDLGSLDFSARGVLLRRRGAKLRTVGLTFSSIRKDEVEGQVQPLLERIGNTEMVALITDPSPDPRRQSRCYFGPLVGDLGTTRRNAVAYEAKANLVSVF